MKCCGEYALRDYTRYLNFLQHLLIGPKSYNVYYRKAFLAYCNVTLQLIGAICKSRKNELL
jgi:hypothetical protein